mmetsp:Transcript_14532/g.34675  ORF Transcript_14532/g.34675 Transcript_14532/m.34675 type:complete len:200 (+) Transcript_14532:654-1253(+)
MSILEARAPLKASLSTNGNARFIPVRTALRSRLSASPTTTTRGLPLVSLGLDDDESAMPSAAVDPKSLSNTNRYSLNISPARSCSPLESFICERKTSALYWAGEQAGDCCCRCCRPLLCVVGRVMRTTSLSVRNTTLRICGWVSSRSARCREAWTATLGAASPSLLTSVVSRACSCSGLATRSSDRVLRARTLANSDVS